MVNYGKACLSLNETKQHVMFEAENFLPNSDTCWHSELLPTSPTENKNCWERVNSHLPKSLPIWGSLWGLKILVPAVGADKVKGKSVEGMHAFPQAVLPSGSSLCSYSHLESSEWMMEVYHEPSHMCSEPRNVAVRSFLVGETSVYPYLKSRCIGMPCIMYFTLFHSRWENVSYLTWL